MTRISHKLEMQRCKGAGEQRRVQCAKFNPLCPSAQEHKVLRDVVRNPG
ncbi:MAG: hypothetical protein V7L23_35480 [Nostoc sp.]